MTDPVYIIDGSAYIFRAFYANPRLTNSGGFPTNALYGFTRMLLKLLNEVNPKHVVMVFDAGRETFRNEIYPEYKANRVSILLKNALDLSVESYRTYRLT